MSDETTQNLERANADEAERRAEAEALQRDCLATIARNLPERVDHVAKEIAKRQPDVARGLGDERIRDLRAELADAAAALAPEVEGAADQIEWPRSQGSLSEVTKSDVHSALFKFLHGRRVDTLAAPLKRYGFDIQGNNRQRQQGVILPQNLYDENDFVSLAEALTSLSNAERASAIAKRDDERAAVEDLWADD